MDTKELEINLLKKKGYYIAEIDGLECKNLNSCLDKIAEAFRFPEYYGHNGAAFRECINDLDWIEMDNYALVIKNSRFLIVESNDDKEYFKSLLEEVTFEWANVPNYNGEEIYRKKSDFLVLYY